MKTNKCFTCGAPVVLTKDQIELEEMTRKVKPDFELIVWCPKCEKKTKKKKADIVNFLFEFSFFLIGLSIIALLINLFRKSPDLYPKVISNLRLISFVTLNIGVGFISSLFFVVLLQNYQPGGHSNDKSHQWVFEGTKAKYRDTTKREVYEHYHGRGSWQNKVKSEWHTIRIIGLIFAGVGGFTIAILKGQSYPIPILLIAGAIALSIYLIIHKILGIEFLKHDDSSNSFQPVNLNLSNLFKGENLGSMLFYLVGFIIVFISSLLLSLFWIVYFFLLFRDNVILNPPLIPLFTVTLKVMGIFILLLIGQWLHLKHEKIKGIK